MTSLRFISHLNLLSIAPFLSFSLSLSLARSLSLSLSLFLSPSFSLSFSLFISLYLSPCLIHNHFCMQTSPRISESHNLPSLPSPTHSYFFSPHLSPHIQLLCTDFLFHSQIILFSIAK